MSCEGFGIGHEARGSGALQRWLRLALGVAALWALAFGLLPWGASLPPARPVMEVIRASELDPGQYFYTRSEETAAAQTYVRNTLWSSGSRLGSPGRP